MSDAVVHAGDGAIEVTVDGAAISVSTAGPPGPPGQWVQVTQAEYDALDPPDPAVLYVVIG